MSSHDSEKWEISKIEYENAFLHARHYTKLRRQDMAFVTTVQAFVFTVIGNQLPDMGAKGLLLSIIAFFVLVLGFNSERRLSSKMATCLRRASEIEARFGMHLLARVANQKKARASMISNALMFPSYYLILAALWIFVWVWTLLA